MNKRTYNSKLRNQSKQRTQDSIIQTAVRLHGEGVTDLEAIAEEAGVSIATIRKYYPTLEDLFLGCTTHFLQTVRLPSLEQLAVIENAEQRLVSIVGEVYALLDVSLGHTWLAYKLEDKSNVMAETLGQTEALIQAAAEIITGGADAETAGFVRAMLSPLTYRAMRLSGGLTAQHCVKHTSTTIAIKLGVRVEQVEKWCTDLNNGKMGAVER